MRQKTVDMIGANFIFIREAVQHTNRVNDDVRVHRFYKPVDHKAVIHIQDQPIRVSHVPRGVEDAVHTLTAEIVDQNMAGHSVSPKNQQLHDRNPPRFRISRISSLDISWCSELKLLYGTGGQLV
ncbi:hypothetical protein D3C74_430100 [compost metagenome]